MGRVAQIHPVGLRGRKGLEIGGGVGLVAALFSPPLLASTIIGAAAGGLETKPAALVISFTYAQQTKKIVGAMAKVLRGRDIDVTVAAIEATDTRYAASFSNSPCPSRMEK